MFKHNKHFKNTDLLLTCALSLLTGALGGVVGAAFWHALHWASDTREQIPWLLFLLPLGGVVTVLLFRLFRLNDHGGVSEIVKNLECDSPVRVLIAPLIFICTVITHLLGGSTGKEGAALQIGGGGAAAIARSFNLKDKYCTILIMSGMSAVFAGVFGTPLTALFFIMEFKFSYKKFYSAILPCLISSFLAVGTASLFGATKETIHLSESVGFDIVTGSKVLLLSVLICVLGAVMCLMFTKGKMLFMRLISQPVLRILAGSVIIIVLTILVGDMRYSGSGMGMAINAIESGADWYDFALKLLFTAVTLWAGFKGGEIVPTFCIGATFGCVMGSILGISPSLAAAIGLVALFAYATNSLISAVFLGVELFGFAILPYVILACVVTTLLSGKIGLFYGRIIESPIYIIKNKIKAAE